MGAEYVAFKGRGPRNCWDCDHNPCDCDQVTKRHRKRGANQLVKRFITLEVEELFKEAQEQAMIAHEYSKLEQDRAYEEAMAWLDHDYRDEDREHLDYREDHYEADYYESLFDPREKYAVSAFVNGEWTPAEWDDPENHYADWGDVEAELEEECAAYNEWDNEWEGDYANDLPEPPQHERAYNRRMTALKGN